MAVQVAPLCEAEDESVSAPHPHPSSASFKCWSRREGGPASPSRAPGWGGPHRPKPGSARQGALWPQPPPQASPRPGPAFPPQPLTGSCSQAPPLRPPPPPPQVPLGSRSAPSGSPSRFQRRRCPGPAPRLPPSFPLPGTGSRDSDKGCAAHPHPQTGILPTSPIARELRGGSERQFSREPSPWQRLLRRHPGVRDEARAGAMWGLEAVGSGSRSQGRRVKH